MRYFLFLCCLMAMHSVSAQQTGLVAQWKMDSNCELKDENASSPVNGVLNDVTRTSNRNNVANAALSFNGTSSYITLGAVEKLKLPGDKSISFWINPVTMSSNRTGSIFCYGTGIAIRYQEQGSTTRLNVIFGNTSYMTVTLTQNQWQLVTLTFKKDFSSTKSKVICYINGAFSSEAEQNKSAQDFTNAIALVGPLDQNNLTNGFRGSLDDLRIYQHTLTAGEVLDIALPVKLEFFRGKKINGSVELSWKTQLEENVSHFNLQKSTDGINFQNFGRAEAGKYNYTAYDISSISSLYVWYRLQIVDKDEKTTYSNVIRIHHENDSQPEESIIKLFPNPGARYINFIGIPGNANITIINNSGMIVKQKRLIAGNALDIHDLMSGLYHITIFDGSKRIHLKFIKP